MSAFSFASKTNLTGVLHQEVRMKTDSSWEMSKIREEIRQLKKKGKIPQTSAFR